MKENGASETFSALRNGYFPCPAPLEPPLGGYCYHVLSRGNARTTVFHKDRDYDAFLEMMAEATLRVPMRVIAYCLMPNHFHMALWPREDGDLSRWMHWLLTTHVHRDLRHDHSSGHVWQGRSKAFPMEADAHLRVVLRYIERPPLRADLVERAELWHRSSLSGAGRRRRSIRVQRLVARAGSRT